MKTIKEIKQSTMFEVHVTSIAEKLVFEMRDPLANKKPDQKVVPVYIFTSRRAKQHYWNMCQKFPDNWRLENKGGQYASSL